MRPPGLMDKALPSGGKDSEFESWGGRLLRRRTFWFQHHGTQYHFKHSCSSKMESTTLLRSFLYFFVSSVNFSDDFMEQRMQSKVTEIDHYLCLHMEGTSDSNTTSWQSTSKHYPFIFMKQKKFLLLWKKIVSFLSQLLIWKKKTESDALIHAEVTSKCPIFVSWFQPDDQQIWCFLSVVPFPAYASVDVFEEWALLFLSLNWSQLELGSVLLSHQWSS